MSTTFAIFSHSPKTDHHGELTEADYEIPHVECAFRSNSICWLGDFEIIAESLADEIEVYPLDNSPQGIYTIGDIKKEILKQKK